MENKPVTIKSIAYKYGAIAGLISAAFSLMIWAMDMTYSESIVKDYFGMAVMLVCIVLAILNFKKNNDGLLSLGESNKLGAAIGLITGIISVLYIALFANIIEPDFVQKIGEVAENKLRESGTFTEEQISQQIEMQSTFFWVTYPFILIFSIFFGFLFGLITGLFTKKK